MSLLLLLLLAKEKVMTRTRNLMRVAEKVEAALMTRRERGARLKRRKCIRNEDLTPDYVFVQEEGDGRDE